MEKRPAKNSFIVKIVSREYSTWQGTITWVETNETQPFRSALELIKMIDNTFEKEDSK